jgi:hypothetical protein
VQNKTACSIDSRHGIASEYLIAMIEQIVDRAEKAQTLRYRYAQLHAGLGVSAKLGCVRGVFVAFAYGLNADVQKRAFQVCVER